MKAVIIALLTLISFTQVFAQEEVSDLNKNSVYLEILGNGIIYSLNYERLFDAGKLKPFIRVGANELHFDGSDTLRFFLISELGLLAGKHKNFFDASIGYTHPLSELDKDRFFIIRAGFRYTGPKGLVIRVAPIYVINTQKGDVFGNHPWLAGAIGYSF